MSIVNEIEENLLHIVAQKTHTLTAGETLGSVARQYHITLAALYKANPTLRSLNPRTLKPGLKLTIPQSPMDCASKLEGKTLDEMISLAAREFSLNPQLLKELMRQETTTFNPQAVSPAGAVGLTQLMPGRVKELGIADPKNSAQNICAGSALLEDYIDKARSATSTSKIEEIEFVALLMYNGGPTRVSGYLKNPQAALPRETKEYAIKIFQRMGRSVPSRFADLEAEWKAGR